MCKHPSRPSFFSFFTFPPTVALRAKVAERVNLKDMIRNYMRSNYEAGAAGKVEGSAYSRVCVFFFVSMYYVRKFYNVEGKCGMTCRTDIFFFLLDHTSRAMMDQFLTCI